MDIATLQTILCSCHSGAMLASARLLEKATTGTLRSGSTSAALARGYVVMARQELFRRIEPTELGLSPTQILPETIFLILKPSDDEIAQTSPHPSLGAPPPREEVARQERELNRLKSRCGRLLFQALVEDALTNHCHNNLDIRRYLTLLDAAEREEIRATLVSEGRLEHHGTDTDLVREFLVYLALLSRLERDRLSACLPILDSASLRKLTEDLATDVDLNSIERTCQPLLAVISGHDEPEHDFDPYVVDLEARAERFHQRRQLVDAASAMMQVARLSTGDRSRRAEDLARSHLRDLVRGLRDPLHLNDAISAQLETSLYPVLEKADQGIYVTSERRLLLELQAIVDETERPAQSLDIYRWITSVGVRPIRRVLPHQETVQAARRLQTVLRYLPGVRLDEPESGKLRELFKGRLSTCQQVLRDRFQPFLEDALDDVGLQPKHPLELVARRKVVSELIDRILADGYFSYFDVRDAISRNNLKLPDITAKGEWGTDDPLLRLDRLLTFKFEGIYRTGQIHGKLLQNLTSVLFGTDWGRKAWSLFIAPYGIALVVVTIAVVLGRHLPGGAGKQDQTSPVSTWLAWFWIISLGTAMAYLFANDKLRDRLGGWLRRIASGLHWLIEDLPLILARHPAFRSAVVIPLKVAWYCVIKPVAMIMAVYLLAPYLIPNIQSVVIWWCLLALVMTTRPFLILDQRLAEIMFDLVLAMRAGLLGRLLDGFDRIYKALIKGAETALVRADEALQSRGNDSTIMTAVRVAVSLVWVPVREVSRILFIVMVEPMLHPLKLPICFVAAKVLYPVMGPMGSETWIPALSPYLGYWLAMSTVTTIIFLMPNAFGFLFWEFRENRGLYAANRPTRPRYAPAGPGGEDMRALFEPGLHGGTLPRIFRRLRKAGKPVCEGGDRARERQSLKQLEDVREAVSRFIRRNLIDPLAVSPGWSLQNAAPLERPLEVNLLRLSTHRAQAFLSVPGAPPESDPAIVVTFEFRAGNLWGSFKAGHWLNTLPPERRPGVALAAAWCLCAAGVQLNDEQVVSLLGPMAENLKSAERSLTLRSDVKTMHYRLDSEHDEWALTVDSDPPDREPAVIRPSWIVRFQDMPWTYDDFTNRWNHSDAGGTGTELILSGHAIHLIGTTPATLLPHQLET